MILQKQSPNFFKRTSDSIQIAPARTRVMDMEPNLTGSPYSCKGQQSGVWTYWVQLHIVSSWTQPHWKQQARQTDPLPSHTCGNHYEHMPRSTFSWYHCWDLFLLGTLEWLSSSAPSKIFPCQLHSLWLSRAQRKSFYQVHERQLLQSQCRSYVHSALLGRVKMLQQNIFSI